jgi:hypothetical protein
MKKIQLSLILIFLSVGGSSLAQEQKNQPNSYITYSMANKISYHCQYNDRGASLFAKANNIVSPRDLDIILYDLDKHLEYAEKFLLELYYIYGIEMGYSALKYIGFSMDEIKIVETVWNKEEKKRNIILEKKRQEKELVLLKRIAADGIFTKEALSVQPDIKIDIDNIATYTVFNDKNECMNYDYECIISKEGKLSLKHPTDTLSYSSIQKFIYHYIADYNIDYGGYKPGSVEIDGKDIPVNSYVNIQFKEQRFKHRGYLDVTIEKNKKTGQWNILPESLINLMRWTCDEPEQLKSDLESAFYNCPQLQEKKGKIQLKIDVYERTLSSTISDKVELSHYFEMTYLKKDLLGGEYIPIEYKVSF